MKREFQRLRGIEPRIAKCFVHALGQMLLGELLIAAGALHDILARQFGFAQAEEVRGGEAGIDALVSFMQEFENKNG